MYGRPYDLSLSDWVAAALHPLLRTMWSRAAGDGLSAAAFSFFRKEGACEECSGLGVVRRCVAPKLLADAGAPLFDGALRVANKVVRDFCDPTIRDRAVIDAVARARGIDLSRPWGELSEAGRRAVLYGCGEEEFDVVWDYEGAEGGAHRWRTTWPGIAGSVDLEYARRVASGAKARRADYEQLLGDATCPACGGDRLQAPARGVQLGGETLPSLCRRSVDAFAAWLESCVAWPEEARALTHEARLELARRALQLRRLGLGHLALDRSLNTLSAGERQRVRLARQLSAPLTDCVYVLDEPTLGLHAKDVDALLEAFRELVAAGNGVVVVETTTTVFLSWL